METENKKCKLRLKSVSKPNEPFEIRSLDKFREVGSYTWIAEKITDEVGFPDCVNDTDDCHCCEGQLFIMRHGAEETNQSTDSFGQVITIINHETGNSNIFTRALHPAQNNGEWQPWQMVATGDPKLIAENNNINEVLSTLRQQIENDSRRIETAENSLLISATVRFDRIEENEVTINAGEIGSTPTAIVYYKPANKFVAADGAGNYWDTWQGMEAYMSGGSVRKDKIYLCKDKIYIYSNTLGRTQETTLFLSSLNNVKLNFTDNRYIPSSGALGTASMDVYKATENYYDCWNQNLLLLKIMFRESSNVGMAFYDENKKTVGSYISQDADIVLHKIIIPPTARYFRVSGYFVGYTAGDVECSLVSFGNGVSDMLMSENYRINGNIAYNQYKVPQSFPVKWADGTDGTYTAGDWSEPAKMFCSYEVTYGSIYKVVQPAITLNSDYTIKSVTSKNIEKL